MTPRRALSDRTAEINPTVRDDLTASHHPAPVGLWSAIAVAVLVAAFGLSLAIGLPLAVSFTASFFLAPAFVAMVVSLAAEAPPERRIWGQLGAGFAVIYAVMVTTTYYLQLAVVLPGEGRIPEAVFPLLAFTPGSALFALDMLGYGFMTLATLAASPVFVGAGLERWLRAWFIAHGLLVVPTLLAPILMAGGADGSSDQIGSLVLIGWSIFFLPLAAMMAVYFARRRRTART